MYKIPVIILVATVYNRLLSCNSNNPDQSSSVKTESFELDKKWAKSFVDSVNTKFSDQIASGDSVALTSH